MDEEWTGRTIVDLRLPMCQRGYEWVEGRETKIQATRRPANVWPEVWKNMTEAQQAKAIREGPKILKARSDERKRRGLSHTIPPEEIEEYRKTMSEAKQKYTLPKAPSVPIKRRDAGSDEETAASDADAPPGPSQRLQWQRNTGKRNTNEIASRMLIAGKITRIT